MDGNEVGISIKKPKNVLMNHECSHAYKSICTIVFIAISQMSMRRCVKCNSNSANVSDCTRK